MFKKTLVGLTLAGLLSTGVALAADTTKIVPGTGPTDAVSKEVPAMKPAAGQTDTGTTKQGAAANSNVAAAPASCTQAELTAMITKAGALSDKDKQKMTMGHLDMAKKSMDLKDMDTCTMHMKEAAAGLGTVTK